MRRDPRTPAEENLLFRVTSVALAWQLGDLTLDQARTECTDHERFQAMRFASIGSADKHAIQELVDAICRQDDGDTSFDAKMNINAGDPAQPPLYLSRRELAEMGYVMMTDSQGLRVWVSPLYSQDGEWFYGPTNVPPGDEKRKRESAMNAAYTDYRRKKHGRGHRDT
jgi:hypothetical protein